MDELWSLDLNGIPWNSSEEQGEPFECLLPENKTFSFDEIFDDCVAPERLKPSLNNSIYHPGKSRSWFIHILNKTDFLVSSSLPRVTSSDVGMTIRTLKNVSDG